MYTIERRHLVKLGGTDNPLKSRKVEIPCQIDEATQYLALWVYRPGESDLGVGTAQIKRNGELLDSAVPFAGNTLILPLNVYKVGADVELELVHPSTVNSRPAVSAWYYDAVADEMIEDKDVSKFGKARPVSVTAVITNGDAAVKDLIVQWVALVWRNV